MTLFEQSGAYLRGHFRLTSGLHSGEYLQCAKVLAHPAYAERLGRALAEKLTDLTDDAAIDAVVSPAMGGIIIGHETARALGKPSLFTERDAATNEMTLRRGFEILPGQQVVVIEDVITTGGSTKEVVAVLSSLGAKVLAAGSIIDRSGGRADVGVPRVSLETLEAVAYNPEDCPLCKDGQPLVKPGSAVPDGMRRLRFEVAYDGTDFHGWQVQPGLATVQGILEEIVGGMEGRPVHVAGSGRTDAGVHAYAQVAAVSLSNPIPIDNFRRAVNRLLPRTIRISRVSEVAADFHPRFDARRKTYEYRIFRYEICSPFDQRFVFHYPYPLNEDAMIGAAKLFVGEHNFTAFAAADNRDPEKFSNVRCLYASSIARNGGQLVYRVTGSGFLKHMVRNMVGVLVEVGKGNLTDADILARLQPRCGIRPGPSMPPQGLFLVSVEYDT